jgi:hypothetical protein
MGISFYYCAKRNKKLTDEEKIEIKNIAKEYEKKSCNNFDISWGYEENPEIIFLGNSRLSIPIDLIVTYRACLFFIKCLNKIRKIVKNAKWSVNINEIYELEWDEEDGWKLPKE